MPRPADDRGTAAKASLPAVLGLLALVLLAACALRISRLMVVEASLGGMQGRRLIFVLTLYFSAVTLGSVYPAARLRMLLAFSVLQLLVLHGPVAGAAALAIWTSFYYMVHARISWWLKIPFIVALYAAAFVAGRSYPGSTALDALTVTFFSSNFALRSALYAYEAAFKKEQLGEAGWAGFLTHLTLLPIGAFRLAPIGFAVLQRGYRGDVDLSRMRRGVGEIALGFTYLAARGLAQRSGILPSFLVISRNAGELDALTALAGCHILLLNLFLEVAGQIHIVVGMLRTLGFDIAPGSESPYMARNVLEFWRRWNTYWRDYLMVLAYYPVATPLRRRPYLAVAVAGACTFAFGGFTHAFRYFLDNPREVTPVKFAQAHMAALVFGFFVTIWMLLEAFKRRRPGGGRPRAAPTAGARARHFLSAAFTLTLVAVILALFARPFGIPNPAAYKLLQAFLRLPSW